MERIESGDKDFPAVGKRHALSGVCCFGTLISKNHNEERPASISA
jgi:hypothetical protein